MVKFFSKIDRETQREAVVWKEGELASSPYEMKIFYTNRDKGLAFREGQRSMLKAGYVQEVKDARA